MMISFLRKNFAKGKPKPVLYCCYRNFDQDSFSETLKSRILLPNLFEKFFAPFKQRNNPFMTKRIRKEIMMRPKLHNKFNKSRTCVNLLNYRKQRNKCTKLLRKAKQEYFTETKKWWKTVKSLFSNKSKTFNRIILHGNNRIIKDNQ